jgi:hypothetical protein
MKVNYRKQQLSCSEGKMNNGRSYHAPLHKNDTLTQTFGCRQSNPDNCAKNSLPSVCAFVRDDGMCLSPPKSWPKEFARLKEQD